MCGNYIISINSRHDLVIEACRRNQPNKSKLALYNPLLSLQQLIKQLYISNKTGHFSYSGGCDVTHIEVCKKALAWTADKQTTSDYYWFKTVIMQRN